MYAGTPKAFQLLNDPDAAPGLNSIEKLDSMKGTDSYKEELRIMKAQRAAAQSHGGHKYKQVLAADGTPVMNKLLGGQ